jgi:hypothetical protein
MYSFTDYPWKRSVIITPPVVLFSQYSCILTIFGWSSPFKALASAPQPQLNPSWNSLAAYILPLSSPFFFTSQTEEKKPLPMGLSPIF